MPASRSEILADDVVLRPASDGTGDGVLATRAFAPGETVLVGYLLGLLPGNDSHATQIGADRWARHGGLGSKVNHSCDPNCGVRLNAAGAFDYAMRNFTIDHFPAVCLCGTAACRGRVTGWKDLPAATKDAYGELVAPYLRAMDVQRHRVHALVGEESSTPSERGMP